jgi:RNA polymerase sigma factor for flagellar operon FliA
MTGDELTRLWQEYTHTGDARLRDRLVLSLAPVVKYIVYRKLKEIPARFEVEDFLSCGLEALIRSIDRYDPDKGASLEQFAWTRIHGAVLDELRSHDWAPRSLRRFEREMAKAQSAFHALYGRRPTNTELADALGVTEEKLAQQRERIASAEVTSLNILVVGDDESDIERIDTLRSSDEDTNPEARALQSDMKERLRAALERLTPRERQIAVMIYVHELNLREIGEVLGVTESRVSQLHTQLRSTLRAILSEDEPALAAAA